jgi:hypothetical protein
LSVKVPALGAGYNPSFDGSTGCSIKKLQGVGEILCYPQSPAGVTIKVKSDGIAIGEKTFKTKPVPNPSFEFKTGGREVNFQKGERPNILNVSINPKPDQGFASACPDDANYVIQKCTAILIVGGRERDTKTYTSGNIRIADFGPQPGARIFIKIDRLVRKTALGEEKEVKMSDQTRIANISFIE